MPPEYVRALGDPVFAPPYYFGTKERPWVACGLRLPVAESQPGKNRLHELCKKYLNDPLEGTVRFEPVNDFVWLNLNDYKRAGLVSAPDTGWLRYTEITFQFAVKKIEPDQEGEKNPKGELRWYVAVLFLDGTDETGGLRASVLPILAGREVSGLPKTVGEIEWARGGFFNLSYARLRALDPPLGGAGHLELQELMEITAAKHPRRARPLPPETDSRGLTAQLLGIAKEDIVLPHTTDPKVGFVQKYNLQVDLSETYGGRLLGLKQLHEAVDFPSAAYQAVVETSFRTVEEFELTHYLYRGHRVQFFPTATIDLPAFLGLDVDHRGGVEVPDDHGFYLEASAIFGETDATKVWHPPEGGGP